MSKLDAQELLVSAENVVFCEIEGGSALLDLKSSSYFRLNETAHFIWEQLDGDGATAQGIATALGDTFEVAPEECLPDVLDILEAFASAELILRK